MKIKRILAFLLMLAMLVGVIPLYAFAVESEAEETGEPTVASEASVTEISGVSLLIDSDLGVNYYVTLSAQDAAKSVEMKYTVDGATITSSEYNKNGDYYTFSYDGFGPHQIGTKITAELLVDGAVVDTMADFSIEGYLEDILKLYGADSDLVTLINDLVAYAQAADTYKNGSTEIAKNWTITASSDLPQEADNKLVTSGNDNADLYVYSAGVRFDTVNKIFFKIYAAEGKTFTATIGNNEYSSEELAVEDGYYIIYSDGISAANFADTLNLTVAGEGVNASVTYSVNTYAYNMQGDEKMAELAKALYRYGKSCAAYASAIPSITYNLNEGTNPDGAPTTFDPTTGIKLPTPTKDGYVFGGWYTTEDFQDGTRIAKVIPGIRGAVVLYAKWNQLVYQNDFEDDDFYFSNDSDHSLDSINYGLKGKTDAYAESEKILFNTSLSVYTSSKSDMQVNNQIKLKNKFIAGGSKITFTVDLAAHADGTAGASGFRLRGAGSWDNTSYIFQTTSKEIRLGSSGIKIADLTSEFTKIAITLDAKAGTLTAYDPYTGAVIKSVEVKNPTSTSNAYETLEEWVENNLYLFNGQIEKGTEAGGGLRLDNFLIYIGDFAYVESPFSGASAITFDTNGGKISGTVPTTVEAGDTLPTPTNASLKFEGWYTDPYFAEKTLISEVPAGAPEAFTVYAKWSGTLVDATFDECTGDKAFKVDSTTKNVGEGIGKVEFSFNTKVAVGESVTVDGNTYVKLTTGASSKNDPQVRKSSSELASAGGGKFTIMLDVAKNGTEALSASRFNLRANGGSTMQVSLFHINSNGTVTIGKNASSGGEQFMTLSEEFQTIIVTVDIKTWTLTAYSEYGTELGSDSLPSLPSSFTSALDYIADAAYTFYWYFSNTESTSILFDNIKIYLGDYVPEALPAEGTVMTYELNGGEFAETPEVLLNSGDALPTPTNGTYTFMGWYDNAALSGTPITAIPEDAPSELTVYASWSGVLFSADFEGASLDATDAASPSDVQSIKIGTQGKTGVKMQTVTVNGNTYIKVVRGSSDPYIRSGSKYDMVDENSKITFVVDLAKLTDTDTDTPTSTFAIRGKGNAQIGIFSTTNDGKVKVGDTNIIDLTTDFQKVIVTFDIAAMTLTAYKEDGTRLGNEVNVSIPSGKVNNQPYKATDILDYMHTTEALFYWRFNDGSVDKPLLFDNIKIYFGAYYPGM